MKKAICLLTILSVLLPVYHASAQAGQRKDYQNGGTIFDAEQYKADKAIEDAKKNQYGNTQAPATHELNNPGDNAPTIYKEKEVIKRPEKAEHKLPADGPGVDEYDGNKYEGTFKNGYLQGEGKAVFADGSVYVGQFFYGKPEGKGQLTDAEGNVYTGEFAGGKFFGKGVFTWKDGRRYEGDFVAGRKQGFFDGTLYYPDGSKFVGRWLNDLQDGPGTEYDNMGNVIRSGTWDKGVYLTVARYATPRSTPPIQKLPALNIQAPAISKADQLPDDGNSSFQFANGDKFDGTWQKHKMVSGVYTFKNGDKYQGSFKNNKLDGLGYYRFSNGDGVKGTFEKNTALTFVRIYWANGDSIYLFDKNIYNTAESVGLYFYFNNGDIIRAIYQNNQIIGEATCWYGNGDMYIGHYVNCKRDDREGVYIYANHDFLRGKFKNDVPDEPVKGEGYPPQDMRPYK